MLDCAKFATRGLLPKVLHSNLSDCIRNSEQFLNQVEPKKTGTDRNMRSDSIGYGL